MWRDLTKRQKLGWVLFLLYLALLSYLMFFSEDFGRTNPDRGYAYNLVPFKEISRFVTYYDILGMEALIINLVGNVAAFMPFGFFMPVVSRRSRGRVRIILLGFGFSLMLETIQLVFRVGSFDVDDLILNTLGAGLGFFCYRRVQRFRVKLKRRRQQHEVRGQ